MSGILDRETSGGTYEKEHAEKQKRLAAISDTLPENPANFSGQETEGKSQTVN